MPIDPNIVSGLAPAAANLAQMGTFAQQQTAMEAHRKRQDEQRQEQELRDIMASSPDLDTAIDRLNKAGKADYATKIRTQADDHRKKLADVLESDSKRDLFELDVLGRAVHDIKDDDTLAYGKRVASAFGVPGQRIASLLPETFDPATTPQQIEALMKANLTAKEAADQLYRSTADLRDGKWRSGLANALATADNQQDWDGAMRTYHSAGMPASELAEFPTQFSPEALDKVKRMALTEQQRRSLAGQDATRTATAERAATDDERMAASAAEAARHNRVMEARPTGGGGQSGGDTGDAKAIAAAIISGDQPPSLTGLYRFAAPVRAELARKGYDLTRATEDWTATQKHLSTLNGAQQTRLRQAVSFTKESVPLIRQLVTEWDSSGLPLLSKANLEAAASGAYGNKQQSLARRLKGQIADLTSELGTVYKGGNSSTDESLKLAAENLQADWSKKAALDALTQIEKNLQFRENSIRNVGPIGGRDQNPYAPERGGGGAIAEGMEKPVPGHPGVVAVYRGGRWIVK